MNETLRELYHRSADMIDVWLLWRESDNAVLVSVADVTVAGARGKRGVRRQGAGGELGQPCHPAYLRLDLLLRDLTLDRVVCALLSCCQLQQALALPLLVQLLPVSAQ